ncbi:CLUMA_CG003742, isoform A [Clunio marinus]|uniref:RNA helicase n=1 Tax=Clunio marinus TaxID=568069 RepID=A0A1J1HV33_9DIPT|nr:CLUMA_CG003742, isoform A [Clunio marinus]
MSRNFNFTPFSYGSSNNKQPQQKSINYGAVPPPAALQTTSRSTGSKAKSSYTSMDAISQYVIPPQNYGSKKRSALQTDDEYFDEDDATEENLEYIPAEGSPATKQQSDSDEEDPLDAFMAGLEKAESKEKQMKESLPTSSTSIPSNKGVRADIDDMDDEESYYKYMEDNPMAGVTEENSGDELEYDEDGNPIAPSKKRFIDPLPSIDHSEIEYQHFEKNFYVIHEEIAKLTKNQKDELRHKLGIKVTGAAAPAPVCSFAHFGFDDQLMKAIRKSEYVSPTPIQAQAIPTALSGRDLIGIAKTGSGKTAAFLWPLIVHILDQPQLKPGDGIIGLILAPTRELSIQIYNEAKKFGKVYNIHVVCCYGGGNKYEQCKALEQGAEICVATPGRMIDMIKMKATNLLRCSYLVLDEADKMFNMGFEPQVRSICNHVNPLRQTLLFSATFKKRIEKLARDVLTDPVRIVQGDIGEANQDITQHAIVFLKPEHKWNWLMTKLVELLSEGSVLIFATKKLEAEKLAADIKLKEYPCLLLHGDIEQAERNKVITAFKKKECDILVATDVASRGLDIPHIKNVINYDMARDIDTHTHRIGRTARGGEKGTAYTLVSDKDKEMVGHLVRNLEMANQYVPDDLMELAMQSSWFRKSRFKGGKGKSVGGGAGLGFRERPNLGGSSSFPKSFVPASDSNRSSGTPTNRLEALKNAFKSQYTSQFKSATDKTWEQTTPVEGVFSKPAPPPPSNKNESTSEDSSKKKKSRWN